MTFSHEVELRGIREGVSKKSGEKYHMVELAWWAGKGQFFVADDLLAKCGRIALGEKVRATFEVESGQRVNLLDVEATKAAK